MTSATSSDYPTEANSRLTIQVIPAITRQATLRMLEVRRTDTVAAVAARVLQSFRLPADPVCVSAQAFDRLAWEEREGGKGKSATTAGAHWCVRTGPVLIDPCLDLLSVPGGSLSLRPSWFDLPPTWDQARRATFRQRQTGSVVRYEVAEADPDDGVESPRPALVEALVDEVTESCLHAIRTLADADPAPARWLAITD